MNFHDFKTLPYLFSICQIMALARDLLQSPALPVPTESGSGLEAGRGTLANSLPSGPCAAQLHRVSGGRSGPPPGPGSNGFLQCAV